MKTVFVTIATALLFSLVPAPSAASANDPHPSNHPFHEPPELSPAASQVAGNAVAYITSVVQEQLREIASYVEAVQEQQREQAQQALLEAQQKAQRESQAQATGACGGATNGADAVIHWESGGNPNVYGPPTPQGQAWGCYQIMPATWNAMCRDLGSYGSASASEQAQCASRLPPSAWKGDKSGFGG